MSDTIRNGTADRPTAEQVLRLMRRMTPQQRHRLFAIMPRTAAWTGGGLSIMPEDRWWRMTQRAIEAGLKVDELLKTSRAGPRKKAADTAKRNHVIDTEAVPSGIAEPEAILAFLKEHYPELVFCGKKFIDAESVMKAYRRSKQR